MHKTAQIKNCSAAITKNFVSANLTEFSVIAAEQYLTIIYLLYYRTFDYLILTNTLIQSVNSTSEALMDWLISPELRASFPTSSATTAKPLPSSPALAA